MQKQRPAEGISSTTGCEQAAAGCTQEQRRAVSGSRSNRLQVDKLHQQQRVYASSVSCKWQQQQQAQTAAADCTSSSRQACKGSGRLQPAASTADCRQLYRLHAEQHQAASSGSNTGCSKQAAYSSSNLQADAAPGRKQQQQRPPQTQQQREQQQAARGGSAGCKQQQQQQAGG